MEHDIYDLPLLAGGSRSTIDLILEPHRLKTSRYAKGDIIAVEGSACRSALLLCGGSAYARLTGADGRELTLDTLSAPEVLASPFVFSTEAAYPVTVIAAADCLIRPVGRDRLRRLIEADGAVMSNFLRIVSDHSMFLCNRVAEFALQTLAERVVGYIRHYGPLANLQQSAFIMGVARPSLSRVVAQLVGQGVLKKTQRGYELAK